MCCGEKKYRVSHGPSSHRRCLHDNIGAVAVLALSLPSCSDNIGLPCHVCVYWSRPEVIHAKRQSQLTGDEFLKSSVSSLKLTNLRKNKRLSSQEHSRAHLTFVFSALSRLASGADESTIGSANSPGSEDPRIKHTKSSASPTMM